FRSRRAGSWAGSRARNLRGSGEGDAGVAPWGGGARGRGWTREIPDCHRRAASVASPAMSTPAPTTAAVAARAVDATKIYETGDTQVRALDRSEERRVGTELSQRRSARTIKV